MCSEILATPCHCSLKPLTQLSVGKQLQEHAARASSEHTGSSMMDRKGEQDGLGVEVCVMWTPRNKDSLLNSRAREAP